MAQSPNLVVRVLQHGLVEIHRPDLRYDAIHGTFQLSEPVPRDHRKSFRKARRHPRLRFGDGGDQYVGRIVIIGG